MVASHRPRRGELVTLLDSVAFFLRGWWRSFCVVVLIICSLDLLLHVV